MTIIIKNLLVLFNFRYLFAFECLEHSNRFSIFILNSTFSKNFYLCLLKKNYFLTFENSYNSKLY